MKIRIGFVSNSSSSSFIISLDAPNKCKECGRSDVNILDLIEKSKSYGYNDDNSIDAIGVDNILKEMKENWCQASIEIKHIQKKLKQEVSLGRKVALISISYHDETLNDLLNTNIKILWKCE